MDLMHQKNFIKYANKNPKATLTLKAKMNKLILFDCVYMTFLNIAKECVYSQSIINWCAYIYRDI